MANYKSFDDVLKDLDMDEDELKRLVSEGQIRAFRDDDRMKFRSEDVHTLAATRTGTGGMGGDLDLGETQLGGEGLEIIEEETDETLLDLGSLSSDQDFEDTGATSVPTVELSDIGDDQDATLTEELVFDETDELGGLDFGDDDADATQKIEGDLDLTDDDELGLQTEPLDDAGLEELDELDEVEVAAAPPPAVYDEPGRAGPPMGMPGPVQIQEQVKYVEIVPNEGVTWKVLNGLAFGLVLFAMCTLPVIGLRSGDDVLSNFWGSFGHSLYIKSSNPSVEQEDIYRYDTSQQNIVSKPIPKTVAATGGEQILWAGQQIIRNFDGYYIGSGRGGEDGGEEPAEPDEPDEGDNAGE